MTKHDKGLTAAVYARISEDRDGTGLGVARQEKDCKALAARRGWHVARVYVDNDISAYSGKPRPQYRQMLDDLFSVARMAQDRLVPRLSRHRARNRRSNRARTQTNLLVTTRRRSRIGLTLRSSRLGWLSGTRRTSWPLGRRSNSPNSLLILQTTSGSLSLQPPSSSIAERFTRAHASRSA